MDAGWAIALLSACVALVFGQQDKTAESIAEVDKSSCCQQCLFSELHQLKVRVDQLENERQAFPKVAFSAALRVSGSGNTGPFQTNTALKYEKVFANFGSSYNPSTGMFTAMVKGVYYFHFTAFSNIGGGSNTNVVLMKNGERTVSMWDKSEQDSNDSASCAAVLQLEVGDSVHVQLMAGTLVYDDAGYYNSFSGFLLFPITS